MEPDLDWKQNLVINKIYEIRYLCTIHRGSLPPLATLTVKLKCCMTRIMANSHLNIAARYKS